MKLFTDQTIATQQVTAMLELQDKMNTKVHPQWREQNFAWHRAIWTECAELMEHYGWKWWKKQSPDLNQVKMELVDIWHFGLSMDLQTYTGMPKEDLAVDMLLSFTDKGPEDFKVAIEDLVSTLFLDGYFPTKEFSQLMGHIGMDLNELYFLYIGKNALNEFRQNHGYKAGTYQKVWADQEDNEVLIELLASCDPASPDLFTDIYDKLSQAYVRTFAETAA